VIVLIQQYRIARSVSIGFNDFLAGGVDSRWYCMVKKRFKTSPRRRPGSRSIYGRISYSIQDLSEIKKIIHSFETHTPALLPKILFPEFQH
jgi:hypothetical protein